MKKRFLLALLAFNFSLLTILNAQTGTWTALTNRAPNGNNGVMLLLTDGSVICHNDVGDTEGTGWDKLTPDIHGSYVNGTWSTIASMHYARLAFSSQVLPSGKVYVGGGEYGPGGTRAELYDPVANIWTNATGIPSGWNLYDGNSELLYTGDVLEGPQIGASGNSFSCLFYNPLSNAFTSAPTAPLNHDEAAWLKLPDSSVLFVGISSRNSCRYIPQTNTWFTDASLTQSIYDTYGGESGPAFMLPNGKAIFFGATQHNEFYTPTGHTTTGTWSAAADFPKINGVYVTQPDAPGAMMVNGHILLAVSPIGTSISHEINAPTWFLEYDYVSNTFTQVTASIPYTGSDSIPETVCQQISLLNLPDGNIIMSISQIGLTEYFIYTPGSAAIAQGKPTINNVIPVSCQTYKLTGKLFNGISEGSAFGDDWQMSSNYPIIRLTNGTDVYYAKTTNWNRVGAVQTDSLEDTTTFTLPVMPGGTYSLVVTANGFASNPILFTVFGASSISQTNIKCYGGNSGSASVSFIGGVSPYTYSWAPSGGTSNSVSGLSAGTYTITATDNAGCTVTQSVIITQTAALTTSSTITTAISCNGASTGAAVSRVFGGASPYVYSWSNGATNATESGLSAGTYTVTVRDSCGGSASTTVVLTQPAAIAVITDSVFATSGCNGQAGVTVSGGTSPYTYSWTGGGQTNAMATGLCAGTYCCYIRDHKGCSHTTCIDLVTGISNISSGNNQIVVYPNPTTGIFNISFVGTQNFAPATIEVFNVLGEKVYSAVLPQTSRNNFGTGSKGALSEIDLSGKPNGVYLYRLKKESGELIGEGKIVVEK